MTAMPPLTQERFVTRSKRLSTAATSMTQATDHVQEVSYDDTAGQSPTEQHVHSGDDSELIIMPDCHNLIRDAHPTSHGRENDEEWKLHGGARAITEGIQLGEAGAYAVHKVGAEGNKQQFAGCDVVLAVLARSSVALTTATFRFGIVDGETSTFVASSKAEVDEDSISIGGFRRLYTVIRGFDSTAFVTDVRMCVALNGTHLPANARVDVTAMFFKPCNVLGQWEPGYFVDRSHDYELIGKGDIPLWDDVVNFDRAQYVAPS